MKPKITYFLFGCLLAIFGIAGMSTERRAEYWRKQYDAEKSQLTAYKNAQVTITICRDGEDSCYSVPGARCTFTSATTATTTTTEIPKPLLATQPTEGK